MSSIFRRFQTGILSIGAFALGIAFEKRFHLQADVKQDATEIRLPDVVPIGSGGDVVDGPQNGPLKQSETALIAKYGFPSMDSLRSYPNFVVSYDRRNRIANWVLERLTREKLASEKYDRSGLDFFEDKSIHHYFRSTNLDYKGSGYDRGHLAAAGNYRVNREHTGQTFVLSNIAPQVGRGFNRDKWNEMEKYCRAKVQRVGEAWICTGPLFLPTRDIASGKMFVRHEVIGRNHVAVPTHFFKVLLYEASTGQYHMECFMLPNAPISPERSLNEFRIDPEVVERAAGILFFNGIARNRIKVIK